MARMHRSTSACASAAAAGAGESGVIASTAAPEQQPPQQQQHKPAGSIDWAAKRRKRLVEDLSQAGRKMGGRYSDPSAIEAGIEALELLIPGFQIDLERIKASEWVRIVTDPSSAAIKLVVLKTAYPGADLAKILQEKPGLLLQDVSVLESNARQVHSLLEGARDRDALLTALPLLLEPRTLISVLITVEKWYFKKKDPIAVLEADPDLIRRAEACDVPLEPVYINEDGSWMAPSLNYKEKRTDWQAYIDRTVYKQKD
ncbi:hypothetical protein MNEG_4306 [Monoraphidium neglectum]|uniref:Uncharacterized protein n=1 Tax=Monoraphidium neglectum TaxID=145388 RepID=A0A0D2MTB0_9CHLO|nr:hypothetical protein MNEG_4306 [Monoraphidium neglectum]KIZ03652.1 hypothetical protein MNEG_4306 [Monoraphidium neglectum]|eukprot:XP_013902671.1 hypothetical protein MNEG_4306 [Monoraphidium neglectum]